MSQDALAVTRVHQDRTRLYSEVARMRAATEVGLGTSLFRVPPILTVDESALTVSVGFVSSYVPLGKLKLSNDAFSALCLKLGRAMRAIHDGVWLREGGRSEPLFHGDPDPYNIGVDAEGQIVLLDWDQAPGLEGVGLSPQQADLGLVQFYLATLFVRKLRPRPVAEESLRLVVEGYCEGDGGMRPREVHSLGVIVGEALTQRASVPGRGLRWTLRWVVRWRALRLLNGLAPW